MPIAEILTVVAIIGLIWMWILCRRQEITDEEAMRKWQEFKMKRGMK